MQRRFTPPGERRVVARRTKAVIVLLVLAGMAALIWYKIPYTKTYRAHLVCTEAGERPLYGGTAEVTVCVRVRRYFFAAALHTGTVTVNGDEFAADDAGDASRLRLSGAFADADTFTLSAAERHGDYLLERCCVTVERGRIVGMTLHDNAGVFAGTYENEKSHR